MAWRNQHRTSFIDGQSEKPCWFVNKIVNLHLKTSFQNRTMSLLLSKPICKSSTTRFSFHILQSHYFSHDAFGLNNTGGNNNNNSSSTNARMAAAQKRGIAKKRPIAGVKHVIAVASGKGGVGKSTVSGLYSITFFFVL